MKKKCKYLLVVLVALLLNNPLIAQNNSNQSDNLCVKKDDILIEAFYGWPYFNGVLLKSISNAYNLSRVRNTNHLGGKVEFMLSESIGIGGEFTYANASIRYQSSTYGFYETAGVSKIRILGRFNYHFATTESLDPYVTIGTGYKRTLIYDSGSSNVDQYYNILPVSFKMAIGLRAYFSDLIGFNAEIGVGGPVVTAGLTLKI